MISGSGAQMQMQSTSYIPAYYHIIDQTVGGGSGSLWQVLGSSSSSTCKIGMVYNVLPESSNSDPYLAYNKEILRQTMLKHEAVFRNQVHELHRLYGKQRELMNEISRNHWQMQCSQSNFISSQIGYNNFQNAYSASSLSPGDDGKQPTPPAQSGEIFQMPSSTDVVSEKSIRARSTINIKEDSLEEQRTSMSKSCYSGKRMLDLELPAEEYIDSEDEQEVLKKRNPVQIMPQVQYEHSKNSLKLNETSSSNGSSNCSKTTFLFDLNEPIQLDESEMPNSADFIDSSTDNIMPRDQDSFGMSNVGSHVQNKESTYNVPEGKGDEGNGLISGNQNSSTGGSILGSKVVKKESEAFDDNNQSVLCSCITNSCSPVRISNEAKTEASTSVSSQQTSVCKSGGVVPFAIQALPCFNNPESLSKKSSSNSGIKRKYCNSKGNLASTRSLESVSCDNVHAAQQSSLADCIKKSHHANLSEDIVVVDVMPKTDVSQEKHSRTDEASSSENSKMQFIMPRIKPDFDGTNLKAPLTPDKNEHPPPSEDLDRIAAEAIVSISSSDTQQHLKNEKIALLPEVSAGSDCLSWFASIASCVTNEQEIDEFEFGSLSFKLNGMNLEDCCCPQIQSHEVEGKGRGKKKKKTSRQNQGSLSCITSLHSSNVIKNLEPAGTIIKAERCFGGCRRRTGGGRRSKKLKTVTTNEIEIETETEREKKVCSILKQHTTTASHEELNFTLKSLLGWGSKNRRQKSRHAPENCFLDF